MQKKLRLVPSVAVAALLISAAGCGGKSNPQQAGAGQTPEVAVVRAEAQSVPLMRDLVGRLSSIRSADVRARVSGIVQKRLYSEGTLVKAGQPLFQIDPAPLRAALNAALASLAQAEASATNAHVVAERDRAIAKDGLISRAELDTAEANERSTAAAVKQAKANVETARINLGYATVTAPISGRAGQQRVTEGALASANEATLLTTVEQLDPIYVSFDQPASEIARLRRAQATGEVTLIERDKAQVQVILPDGQPYDQVGVINFSDFAVDPATNALAFRAVLPNPDRQLLPGMFVNVRLMLGEQNHAYLIPPAALKRDTNGAFVQVVGADGKVEQKRVTASTLHGANWVVTEGLADGDQVIVTSGAGIRPGVVAKAVPYSPPQREAQRNTGQMAQPAPGARGAERSKATAPPAPRRSAAGSGSAPSRQN
jgi:membrane fusion protein, multidrug efflux system